ncbi:MAG: hydroxylamine reductase [Myxococcota bacterium]|jgi:hydroxylamine reductase|nr:hydroxylamine reductase [Myxococcota bacterium]
MFCYQCEQALKGTGCTSFGVCGKDSRVAALQDLLIHAAQGLAMVAFRAAGLGVRDPAVDTFVQEALFTTVTNVNFDAEQLGVLVRRAVELRQGLLGRAREAGLVVDRASGLLIGTAAFQPAGTLDGLVAQGEGISLADRLAAGGPDRVGLQELVLYGLKGMAAYADHARILGHVDPSLDLFFHEVLDFLSREQDVPALVAMALKVGEVNLKVMELLDRANTGAYGHPVPTPVRITPVAGKAILVSGHDLKDLYALLEQTAGTGIQIYTHGEMLPAHGYPGLKKFPHLAGNYGGAWQDQRKEFNAFPGAILMTTNCIQAPADSYMGRIFTCGLVRWPGVTHISDRDFRPVIEAALAAPGFPETEPERTILVGFGHEAVLGVAGQVVEAVKKGEIKHFFLIGGCDGAKPGRNYYTELAEAAPPDSVILTLACGKYRFNKLDFGTVAGLPRLLDVGQCNDAYSAIQIAVALANAFDTDVNGLPLSLVLSWYEQKAVVVLLTLLHLGIKNIRLGPTLPAFVGPAVLDVLVNQFGLLPTTTADADLATMLGK